MTKWKLVPCEPTLEMLDAGSEEAEWFSHPGDVASLEMIYPKIIAAAPAPDDAVEVGANALAEDVETQMQEQRGDGGYVTVTIDFRRSFRAALTALREMEDD